MKATKDKTRNARMKALMLRLEASVFAQVKLLADTEGQTPTGFCRACVYRELAKAAKPKRH